MSVACDGGCDVAVELENAGEAAELEHAMHIAIEQPFMAWRPRFRTNAKPVPQAVAVAQ